MNLFIPGKVYNRRRDIHARYGGQEGGGISTPAAHPMVFLFTGKAGIQFGYGHDRWREDGLFDYTGEGQVGDMQMGAGTPPSVTIRNAEGRFTFSRTWRLAFATWARLSTPAIE
jgi:hypothetical protein